MVECDILLTGGSGQVGTELQRLAPLGMRIVAPGRDQLDIADSTRVASVMASHRWAAAINAAAYTAVDHAERNITEAWRVNALGPAILAEITARAGVPLIQLSTDYVFDGRKTSPYSEDDPVAPLSVYGASKEGGEQAVRTGNPRHIILRTAWVISPHGKNFVKTMLHLATVRPVLGVVDDQRGCPTSATDIAHALLAITRRLIDDSNAPTGIYHFVNDGEASWCELARAIFAASAARGRSVPTVNAINSNEYPSVAKRPANSRLSTSRLRRDFDITPRHWQPAVEDIVDVLLARPEGKDQ